MKLRSNPQSLSPLVGSPREGVARPLPASASFDGNTPAVRNPSGTGGATLKGLTYQLAHHGDTLMKMATAALFFTAIIFAFHYRNNTPPEFRTHEPGVTHVLVTGGAGYIGSHATLRLLGDGYRVTIIDNLSRGNWGAISILRELAPPGKLQFIKADLGDAAAVNAVFSNNAIDVVMHFAAVAYVGESMAEPLRYYHNITSNTLTLMEAMSRHGVKNLIYSSTCATYGEPDVMPIVETTPQRPINPYGKAKKMAEDLIKDYARTNKGLAVTLLRYFNVIGSDPEGRLGEYPRPELRNHGRISGACFDAALGNIDHLKILGTDYKTHDGTCIRDYIHVTDLVDAHVAAMEKQAPGHVDIYNVGTGKGYSVREFVNACLKVTGVPIKVIEIKERRPGDYAEVYSDPTKINTELGWKAKYTSLEETLGMAWRWRVLHPNGYHEELSR